MLHRFLLTCAALLVATACAPLSARPLVDVGIVDRDNGQWLAQYRWRGDSWVPGVPGHRYAVRLTNTTGERVLVVLSVDGVNAVSGEDADPGQAGYVLAPWESTEIAGWRKSLDDVAQFYFTALPDSYAARTGRPDNVGVIGIAAFRERRLLIVPMPPPVWEERRAPSDDAEARAEAAPAPSSQEPMADASAPAQRIGTGHGEREWAPVGQTRFVRASGRPAQIVQLRYDAPDRLAALGILPRPGSSSRWSRNGEPQAFPGGFVADPPYRY